MATGIVINPDGTATWTIVSDDTGGLPLGPIRARFKFWRPFIPARSSLYGYWPMSEGSGSSRVATQGIATATSLAETGGAVSTAAGNWYAKAVASTEASTSKLLGTVTAANFSSGFTIAQHFYMPASASNNPKSMFSFGTGGIITNPVIYAYRYFGSDFLDCVISTNAGLVSLAPPRLGPFSVNAWHMLLIRYDPTTGRMNCQVDDLPLYPPAGPPYGQLNATVSTAIGSSLTALDTLNLTGKFNGNFVNWDGRLGPLAIWTKPLTEFEGAGYYTNPNAALEIEGDLYDMAPVTDFDPAPASWGTSPTLSLTETNFTHGNQFDSTLTLLDSDGSQIDLTNYTIDWHLFYEPEGSSSDIPLNITFPTYLAGHIYYTDYNAFPALPTYGWEGASLELHRSVGNGLIGTGVTGVGGAYSFMGLDALIGVAVYILVVPATPPGQGGNQLADSSATPSTIHLGETVIDLTCTGAL